MFRVESYVAPIILSYIEKYVKDYNPSDAQVSLWGGGFTLQNLVLKVDVLQKEIPLPFTLVSGRIHELTIQVPWTKIMSEPIEITIDTMECILSLNPPPPTAPHNAASPNGRAQLVEAPPGYMQAMVRRIVGNMSLRVHHLIVKYVQDDIVLSLNVKHLSVSSAGSNWTPALGDVDPENPVIRRLVRLDDVTLCLDQADSDGKIRFFQEPILNKCELEFRMETKLQSANTRRASSITIYLSSSKLACSFTNEQLLLLLRLFRERPVDTSTAPPSPKPDAPPLNVTSSDSAEPARQESWTEWALSWLSWSEREGQAADQPAPCAPVPINFMAYMDSISVLLKVLDKEPSARRKARTILELCASHSAVKCFIRAPTIFRLRAGIRTFTLVPRGKIESGSDRTHSNKEETGIYIKEMPSEDEDKPWTWPKEDLANMTVQTAQEAGEEKQPEAPRDNDPELFVTTVEPKAHASNKPPGPDRTEWDVEHDPLWDEMSPVLLIDHLHERTPPEATTNPYDNPPTDFEYSDWAELCSTNVVIRPLELKLCSGLIQRLGLITKTLSALPPVPIHDSPIDNLITMEDFRDLRENCPQRRFTIEMRELLVRAAPWDHHASEKTKDLTLDFKLSKASMIITAPLYPYRVSFAASQLPDEQGLVWQAAHLNVICVLPSLHVQLTAPNMKNSRISAFPSASNELNLNTSTETTASTSDTPTSMAPTASTSESPTCTAPAASTSETPTTTAPITVDKEPAFTSKTCARAELRLVARVLLNNHMFHTKESVLTTYSLKICEANICGSSARLRAAFQVLGSLVRNRPSLSLQNTTLLADALNDEEDVAIDMTLEDLNVNGSMTNNVNTHVVELQSARANMHHAPKGKPVSQAWLFSAPDIPTKSSFLRMSIQWCDTQTPKSIDYFGLWTQPISFSLDPLLLSWLAYQPTPTYSELPIQDAKSAQTLQLTRRRPTPSTSSGKSRPGWGAECVHTRGRSAGSSSEPSESPDKLQPKPTTSWWTSEVMTPLYERARWCLVNVELGLLQVYISGTSASAIDCNSLRSAMEQHAARNQPVLVLSLGKITLHSNEVHIGLWEKIKHNVPSFIEPSLNPRNNDKCKNDCFPWKLRLTDVSSYTLERSQSAPRKSGKKLLKSYVPPVPKNVLELISSTMAISIMTKRGPEVTIPPPEKKKGKPSSIRTQKTKYFTTGLEFRPSTLKEFLRGPAKRNRPDPKNTQVLSDEIAQKGLPLKNCGPLVSIGAHIYMDPPPLIAHMTHDQVPVVAAAVDSIRHAVALLMRRPVDPSSPKTSSASSLAKSPSEMDENRSQDTSENQSEQLISIYDPQAESEPPEFTTSFWFQCVMSRASLVVPINNVKLMFDLEDMIFTIDFRSEYRQIKFKASAGSITYQRRLSTNEWATGPLFGRILEAREPANASADATLISITLTDAQISKLPNNWKDDIDPKLFKYQSGDRMWEVYAYVAPLEVAIQPAVLRNIMVLLNHFVPRSSCTLQGQTEPRNTNPPWPYIFVDSGGLRLLVAADAGNLDGDDTLIFKIAKIAVSPYPDNPIIRRPINEYGEPSLTTSNPLEGHQYEVIINKLSVQSAQLRQLICHEYKEKQLLKDNPAVLWGLPTVRPVITTILHPIDVGTVFAPAFFNNGSLKNGPAIELNVLTDCLIELNIPQVGLCKRLFVDISAALTARNYISFDDQQCGVCHNASLPVKNSEETPANASNVTLSEEFVATVEPGPSSRPDVMPTRVVTAIFPTDDNDPNITKSASATDTEEKSSDYLEVFVTMGAVDTTLYVKEGGSDPMFEDLTPSSGMSSARGSPTPHPPNSPVVTKIINNEDNEKKDNENEDDENEDTDNASVASGPSDENPHPDFDPSPIMRSDGKIPLVHVKLHQPNMYYLRRKSHVKYQASLFNAVVELGVGEPGPDPPYASVFSTAQGTLDPATDIPPALVTLKMSVEPDDTEANEDPNCAWSPPPLDVCNVRGANQRGILELDVERPVQLEVSTDSMNRINEIIEMVNNELNYPEEEYTPVQSAPSTPLLYRMKRQMMLHSLNVITVNFGQISVRGLEWVVGMEGGSVQVTSMARGNRLHAKVALHALLVANNPLTEQRVRLMLQPAAVGLLLDATWDSFRRIGSKPSLEPIVRVCLDLDQIEIDFRPEDLKLLSELQKLLKQFFKNTQPGPSTSADATERDGKDKDSSTSSFLPAAHSKVDPTEHHFRDDLRNGAFQLIETDKLPMAYQVTLHGQVVTWRYAHLRTITRLVAFPLPGQDKDINCVLEYHGPMQNTWHPYAYFTLRSSGPNETKICSTSPEAVFALMWRYRPCTENENETLPFKFDMELFTPTDNTLLSESETEMDYPTSSAPVTAMQLVGIIRVDSYYAPRAVPRFHFSTRMSYFGVYLHNSLLTISSQSTDVEGYYVGQPHMINHRVLAVAARDVHAQADLAAPSGSRATVAATLQSDVLESSIGTMDPLVLSFKVQVSATQGRGPMHIRVYTAPVHLTLHVPRLRTLQALAEDWINAFNQLNDDESTSRYNDEDTLRLNVEDTRRALDGRVSLWVYNCSTSPLRIGQLDTEEILPLKPDGHLAYRWKSPSLEKKIRLSLASPSAGWSSSIPFAKGKYRVQVGDAGDFGAKTREAPIYAYINVTDDGCKKMMHITGRVVLSNMMRFHLNFKFRARYPDDEEMQTVSYGDLDAECIARSVYCGTDCDIALKVRFAVPAGGWTGDIPLKDDPTISLPWLVKIPNEGVTQYIAAWCRVIHGQVDGRINVCFWPLYTLYSHVPLDIEVLTQSEMDDGLNETWSSVQYADGRGYSNHLVLPGTSTVQHSLVMNYSYLDCPVMRRTLLLTYGYAPTYMFEEYCGTINYVDEILDEIKEWMSFAGSSAVSMWPYSTVIGHWPGEWEAALQLPFCEVNAVYKPVGSNYGCCLQMELHPEVMFCNATSIPLTIRGHDATPLCLVYPGNVVCPPIALVKNYFYMTVDVCNQSFACSQMKLNSVEPDPYVEPPPGHLLIDHYVEFLMNCNFRVALLNLYYDVEEEMHIFGVSSTYELINYLDFPIMVSQVAVPRDTAGNMRLNPCQFTMVQPVAENSTLGIPMTFFWLNTPWTRHEPDGVIPYMSLALVGGEPVPVHLGAQPYRRALAIVNVRKKSYPIVVCQTKYEGRWIVTLSHDSSPQFVVLNKTFEPLGIAQPRNTPDLNAMTLAEPDCTGLRFWSWVNIGAMYHYSSPAFNARYSQLNQPEDPHQPAAQLLTFGRFNNTSEPYWSAPVTVTEGEQIIQLYGGLTIKLITRIYPHSTCLELYHVNQSASDFRNYLIQSVAAAETQNFCAANLRNYSFMQSHPGGESSPGGDNADELPGPSTVYIVSTALVHNNTENMKHATVGESDTIAAKSLKQFTQPNHANENSSLDAENNASAGNVRQSPESDVIIDMSESETCEDNFRESRIRLSSEESFDYQEIDEHEREDINTPMMRDRLQVVVEGLSIQLAASEDTPPVTTLHLDRVALLIAEADKGIKATVTVAGIQVDNSQYSNGLYDFAVVVSGPSLVTLERRPLAWSLMADPLACAPRIDTAKFVINIHQESWTILDQSFTEITEVELTVGHLALFVEDEFIHATTSLLRLIVGERVRMSRARGISNETLDEVRAMQRPLRLHNFVINPLDISLTLRTAIRMYIALDQSPLRLGAFRLNNAMTSMDRLIKALTVHYLSAAMLEAGWMVSSLELLGAPGAVAARLGGAGGGIRSVAATGAAALIRAVSACAGSLARNLDLLAGDQPHAERAAANRRRTHASLAAGLRAGLANLGVNILGAVGGLAHHPLVGMAVGETSSGITALRRSLLGAFAKPLSATADLVAYAGRGLLNQTGWDPLPKARPSRWGNDEDEMYQQGWRRDCVRWSFQLGGLLVICGFDALFDLTPVHLLITNKYLVVAEPDTDNLLDMIDLKCCALSPYQGDVLQLCVIQRKPIRSVDPREANEDEEYQINAAAMARVARYTGADSAGGASSLPGGGPGGLAPFLGEIRHIHLITTPDRSLAMHYALAVAIRNNTKTHFQLL